MALATKCPHCHTVFRVALDQLKLRGGIVRCGACNEIFDGNAALVQTPPSPASPLSPPPLDLELDLEPLPEPVWEPEPLPEPEPEPEPESQPEPEPEPDAEPEPEPLLEASEEERREPAFDIPSEHIVAVALDDLHHFDEAPAAPAPGTLPDEPADRVADDASAADLLMAAPESALLAAGAGAAAPPSEPDIEADEDEPEFVRQANRRARGAQLARMGMIAGVPLLAFLLLGQGIVVMRNSLAADHPDLKPALAALCAPLGCTVELPRQIEALAIEQGELQTLAPSTYRFTTVLRNGGRGVQAWPHLELVLNDAADKPVLRRVFAPRDYLGRPADEARGFAPRSEQPVKLYFTLDGIAASGYHIAIFYP